MKASLWAHLQETSIEVVRSFSEVAAVWNEAAPAVDGGFTQYAFKDAADGFKSAMEWATDPDKPDPFALPKSPPGFAARHTALVQGLTYELGVVRALTLVHNPFYFYSMN